MERIIVDDNVSAFYAMQLKQRLDDLEQSGMGKDESGNVVTVSADQVVTQGTEIGGITIGANRTAFYAPNVEIPEQEKVTVTPLVTTGTKIANIKVGNTLSSVYAPNSETVEVTPIQTNGVRVATIKIGNRTETLYAPEVQSDGSGSTVDISGKLDAPARPGTAGQVLATNGQGVNYWTTMTSGEGGTTIITGDGAGPMPLLKDITLTENVSTIVISADDNGNPLSIAEGFYIEGELEVASENTAQYFTVSIGGSASTSDVPIMSSHTISISRATYIDVYAKQVAPKKWLVEARSKLTKYDTPTALGTNVGQLGYDCWNGLNNPNEVITRIAIGFSTSNVGKNSKIKIYGR